LVTATVILGPNFLIISFALLIIPFGALCTNFYEINYEIWTMEGLNVLKTPHSTPNREEGRPHNRVR
jgi:hypothetical protein